MKREAKDQKKKIYKHTKKHGLDKLHIKRIPEIYQNKKTKKPT